MKRRLVTLAILLLLGAVLNVAVAWGLALWLPWPHTWPTGDYREGFTRQGRVFSDWFVDSSRAAGFARVHSVWSTGDSQFAGIEPERNAEQALPAWAGFARPTESVPRNTFVRRIVDARGWPMVSLWSGLEASGFPGPAAIIGNVVTVTNGYLPPAERSRPFPDVANLRVVPLMPIWPGFAINTLLYAAILWLAIPGPFALRRHIRRKRGLCEACGYDLRHADHAACCPECGWRREGEG